MVGRSLGLVWGLLIGGLNKIWSSKLQFSKVFVMNGSIVFESHIVARGIIDTLVKIMKISEKYFFRYA